jgi:hypothetical protein
VKTEGKIPVVLRFWVDTREQGLAVAKVAVEAVEASGLMPNMESEPRDVVTDEHGNEVSPEEVSERLAGKPKRGYL